MSEPLAAARFPRRIAVILNPASGRGQGARLRPRLETLLASFASSLEEWRIVETQAPGQAQRLAAEAAAQGAAIVAAAGGDGTLSEVANGLVGTGARLGLLPFGTGNDFSRCLGIGTDIEKAVRALVTGIPRPVDLGRTGDRWFINIAGCGFDAVVAERVNRGFRALTGTSAYLAAVFQTLRTFRAADLRLCLDGETRQVRAMLCSVCNATSYGGGMKIAPEARIDDGLFDVCLLKEAGRIEFLRAFPRVFQGTHVTHPKVEILRARRVAIESDPPLPVLVDGEILGTTPAEFTLHPRILEVIAPATSAAPASALPPRA